MKLQPLNLLDKFINGIKHFLVCFVSAKLLKRIIIVTGLLVILFPMSIEPPNFPTIQRCSQVNYCSFVVFDNFFHSKRFVIFKTLDELTKNIGKFLDWNGNRAFAMDVQDDQGAHEGRNDSSNNRVSHFFRGFFIGIISFAFVFIWFFTQQ